MNDNAEDVHEAGGIYHYCGDLLSRRIRGITVVTKNRTNNVFAVSETARRTGDLDDHRPDRERTLRDPHAD